MTTNGSCGGSRRSRPDAVRSSSSWRTSGQPAGGPSPPSSTDGGDRMTVLTYDRRTAPTALRLLASSRAALREAERFEGAAERYATAHLAALRAAAAILAARARPSDVRRRPTSAWVLLSSVAPELGEWATYFAAG